jgi:predicted ferric reductase
MARLKLAFVAFALMVIAAWLLSIDVSLLSGNFRSVRGLLVLLTGFLAIAFMSAAILLSARAVQIEKALGGKAFGL